MIVVVALFFIYLAVTGKLQILIDMFACITEPEATTTTAGQGTATTPTPAPAAPPAPPAPTIRRDPPFVTPPFNPG